MNLFKTSLLCAGLILSPGASRAQFILAGDPVGNYYHDVNPDSLMEALCVHLSPYPPDSVKLDVDSDGVYDFIIQSGADGGLGGGSGGCGITPLQSYASVVSHLDTSEGCCPSQYVAELADTLQAGDVISQALRYNTGFSYFWSTTYGMAMGPIIDSWNNIGEHFTGIRLSYPFDTLYGWIRVEAVYDTLFKFYVKDFACNRNTHIGINEIQNQHAAIYPNPFSDKLIIQSASPGPSEILIYDVTGRLLMKNICAGNLVINTGKFEKGIYMYRIRHSDGTEDTGKMVRD